jgi:hypothetical protein
MLLLRLLVEEVCKLGLRSVQVEQQGADHETCAPLASLAMDCNYIVRVCCKPGGGIQAEVDDHGQRGRLHKTQSTFVSGQEELSKGASTPAPS